MTPSTECASPGCRQAIDWAEKFPLELDNAGRPKTIPVNHDSADDPTGNIEVWRQEIKTAGGATVQVLYARYLRKGQEPEPGHHRGISHFATCPDRDRYRRNPKGGRDS